MGLALLLTFATSVGAEGADTRVTTRHELKQVKPVLLRVARLCTKGFAREEAERLAADVAALHTDKSGSWEFAATCKGQPHALRVRAMVDELSRVDLDFWTDADLAAQIRQAIGD